MTSFFFFFKFSLGSHAALLWPHLLVKSQFQACSDLKEESDCPERWVPGQPSLGTNYRKLQGYYSGTGGSSSKDWRQLVGMLRFPLQTRLHFQEQQNWLFHSFHTSAGPLENEKRDQTGNIANLGRKCSTLGHMGSGRQKCPLFRINEEIEAQRDQISGGVKIQILVGLLPKNSLTLSQGYRTQSVYRGQAGSINASKLE